ncbi:DNA-directed RNA polymerase subunit L [Halolamina pelagica]|uniref:DNA-directed RNA polymerase subunit L n=1 Tax=Halolamina pelagica TaxID=699431 RepID=A0A0N8I0C5_9EURY|nr:DNA-directed RNA polymerase subunit L [Halolamina pelagica]
MELRVIEKTEKELRIEVAGEGHTFMNVLKGTLLENDDVAAATYDVNPEQSGARPNRSSRSRPRATPIRSTCSRTPLAT